MAGTRWAVAAMPAGGLWAPAAASAGTYDVVSCNAPGAGGANNAWRGEFTSFNRPPEPYNYDVYDGCRGPDQGLVATSPRGGWSGRSSADSSRAAGAPGTSASRPRA